MMHVKFIPFVLKTVGICTTVFAICSSAQAQDVTFSPTDIDSFVGAMIANGCVVTQGTAEIIERRTGFSNDKLEAIVNHLVDENQIVMFDNGDGLKLINEGCP